MRDAFAGRYFVTILFVSSGVETLRTRFPSSVQLELCATNGALSSRSFALIVVTIPIAGGRACTGGCSSIITFTLLWRCLKLGGSSAVVTHMVIFVSAAAFAKACFWGRCRFCRGSFRVVAFVQGAFFLLGG